MSEDEGHLMIEQDGGTVIDLTTGAGTRLERDALGPRAIPAEALYGIHTLRAVEVLGISGLRLGSEPGLVSMLGAVKQAAARANADAGALTAASARAIDRAAGRLRAGDVELLDACIADLLSGGGSIAVHMNINEIVANVANLDVGQPLGGYDPVSPKQHVGASQSTADVCHTAGRLAVLVQLDLLDAAIAGVLDSLQATVAAMQGVDTLARTCWQDAMAAPAGLLFEGTSHALGRRRIALTSAAEPLAGVTLGGTVIGTGAGAPARYRERVVPHLCEVTGRGLFLHPHRASALQHSDDLVAVAAAVTAVSQVVAKLAQDIRLLSSGPRGGLGELVVPHVVEGSSFFGDKANPVVPETVISAHLQILGHDATVRAAAGAAEANLQVFDQLTVVHVLQASRLLTHALDAFDQSCLQDLRLDEARCRELAALGRPSIGIDAGGDHHR